MIKITPFDLLLLVISLFLFCVCAIDITGTGILALFIVAPLYAVFSHRIGGNFSFLIPIIAYIISFSTTKDSVAPTIIIFAAGTSFSILSGIFNCPDRAKSSAVAGSVFSAGLAVLAALLAAKVQYGINPSEIVAQLEAFLDASKEQTLQFMSSVDVSTLGYTGYDAAETAALTSAFYDQAIYVMPTAILLAAMIFGYFSVSFTRPLASLCNAKEMLSDIKFEVRLTYTSVIVYFVCTLLTIFMTGKTAFVLSSLLTLLSPALMLCGAKQIRGFFTRKNYSKVAAVLMTILAVVVICILPMGLGSTVLGLLGLYYCVSKRDEQLQQ